MDQRKIKLIILETDFYYNRMITRFLQVFCLNEVYPFFDFRIRSYQQALDCAKELEDNTDILIMDSYQANGNLSPARQLLSIIALRCRSCKIIPIAPIERVQLTMAKLARDIHDHLRRQVPPPGPGVFNVTMK